MEKSKFDELKRKFKTNELYNLYLETGEDFEKVARSMSRVGQMEIEEAKEFLQEVIDEHELASIKSIIVEKEEPQVHPKKRKNKNKKKKINKLLLVSFILGVLYVVYSMIYWGGVIYTSAESEVLGGVLAFSLVTPHLICSVTATVFNGFALFLRKRWMALTGAIIYAVAVAAFPMYFIFVIIEAILSFVAFATMDNN